MSMMSPVFPDEPVGATEIEYLSPQQFACLSGLSNATVRRYLADGRLPKIQPGGQRCRVLIPRDALNASFRPQSMTKAEGEASVQRDARPEEICNSNSPPKSSGPTPRWRQRR